LRELKATVREMQRTIEGLNRKLERMEERQAEQAVAPAATPTLAIVVATPPQAEEAAEGEAENVISSQGIGPQAPIDPALRGFVAVPHTKVIIRFNAKPRVDFTYDTQNAGDDSRFVTAKIPVSGDPDQGDGPVFNANAKGSQLIIDVRGQGVAGNPRFYYQNDFFGSGSAEFNYRIQHLYGSVYGVTVGQTFSPFEDPDIWPDTVDYEGPNSMIFARFPLVRYRRQQRPRAEGDRRRLSRAARQPLRGDAAMTSRVDTHSGFAATVDRLAAIQFGCWASSRHLKAARAESRAVARSMVPASTRPRVFSVSSSLRSVSADTELMLAS
jgi:hypothetical protein